jgi:hypothetical protein
MISCQGQNEDEFGTLENTQEEQPYAIAEKMNNNILSAVDKLENGNVIEGADLLLEAVLLTKPKEYMPEGFENKISLARDQFHDGNLSEGIKLVSEALLIIKSSGGTLEGKGKEELKQVVQTQEKDNTPPIAEIVSHKILAAHQQFKSGNTDKGVVLLLESLQLCGPQKK